MVGLTTIGHAGLKVSDPDRTLDFYRRRGLTVLRTAWPNADGFRSAVVQVGARS